MQTVFSRTPDFLRSVLVCVSILIGTAAQGQFDWTTNNGAITISQGDRSDEFLEIPDTIYGMPVTSIGPQAFQDDGSLKYITIPDSVTNIGVAAFANCTGLSGVTLPTELVTIEDHAFDGCVSLTNIAFGNNLVGIGDVAFIGCTNLTLVTIPDSVVTLGNEAFRDCIGLSNVFIGRSVTNLTIATFLFCTNLAAIDVDPSNIHLSSSGGVVFEKPHRTLIVCPEGKSGSYVVPQHTSAIGFAAFSQCASLESVVIPNSVQSIGAWAFEECQSLRRATIGDGTTKIDDYCFQNCTSLTDLVLSKHLATIGRRAFAYCSSLTNIVIPKSVTTMGIGAFGLCTNLVGVYFVGNAPDAGQYLFLGDSNATAYYLPNTKGWGPIYADLPTAEWARKEAAAATFMANHTPIAFYANLSGGNEIPTNETMHSGGVSFLLQSNVLSYSMTIDPDFHPASAGIFGPANPSSNSKHRVSWLNITDAAEDGTYNGSILLRRIALLRLLTGRLYVNLISEQFPKGELRGAILPDGPPEFVASLTMTNRHVSSFNPGDDDVARFEMGSAATEFYIPGYFWWSNATVEIMGPSNTRGEPVPDIPVTLEPPGPTNPGPGESGLIPMSDVGYYNIVHRKVSVNSTIPGIPAVQARILPEDGDGNGIPDYVDAYLEQVCPCEADWKNHQLYLASMRDVVLHFAVNGIITWSEARAILREARQSTCGQNQ